MDIDERIARIDRLMSERSRRDLETDLMAVAAFERFPEIISEASRHIPDEFKARHPQIPWRQVADIGNWLRHAYQRIDADLLLAIHSKDLGALREAVRAMLAGGDVGTSDP